MMDDAKPQLEPGGVRAAETPSYDAPSQPMPAVMAGTAVSAAPPYMMTATTGHESPMLPVTAGMAGAVAGWQNSKKVTSLWSNNQDRNSWIGIEGVGWKKLANTNLTSNVALAMLCAHAREKDATINYREENDGMVHEVYIW